MSERGVLVTRNFVNKTAEAIARIPPKQMTGFVDRSLGKTRFWVKLGDEDSDNAGRYKWKQQIFPSGDPEDRDPAILAGDDYTARELNEKKGLSSAFVEIVLVGQDSDGKPVYVFAFDQSTLKVLKLNKSYTLQNQLPGGYYSASLMKGDFDPKLLLPNSQNDLTMPLGMEVDSDGGDVLWVNLDEDAQTNTHNVDMDTPAYVYGFLGGQTEPAQGQGSPQNVYYGFCVRGAFKDWLELKDDQRIDAPPMYTDKDNAYWQRDSKPQIADEPSQLDKGGRPVELTEVYRAIQTNSMSSYRAAPSTALKLIIFNRISLLDAQGRMHRISEEKDGSELISLDYDFDTIEAPKWGPDPALHSHVWTYKPETDKYVRVEPQTITVPTAMKKTMISGENGGPGMDAIEVTWTPIYGMFNLDIENVFTENIPLYKFEGDDTWIEVTTNGDTVKTSHIGPDENATGSMGGVTVSVSTPQVTASGITFDISVSGGALIIDAKGHVVKEKTDGEASTKTVTIPLESGDALTSITITCNSDGSIEATTTKDTFFKAPSAGGT